MKKTLTILTLLATMILTACNSNTAATPTPAKTPEPTPVEVKEEPVAAEPEVEESLKEEPIVAEETVSEPEATIAETEEDEWKSNKIDWAAIDDGSNIGFDVSQYDDESDSPDSDDNWSDYYEDYEDYDPATGQPIKPEAGDGININNINYVLAEGDTGELTGDRYWALIPGNYKISVNSGDFKVYRISDGSDYSDGYHQVGGNTYECSFDESPIIKVGSATYEKIH